ncbi:MAG: bifunctional ADP-dependent NAD(P)H-hydrate dehydratase/NAD(P)H-hydrate epimerase, partial [Desulfovibrionaceae bacterium]|nr:bifunctional ADP-dependent NAD(P)H-hydrate dehydratase/NAD(P)H-hydrate epimerase [Desulfovibrionaceae bacterium]
MAQYSFAPLPSPEEMNRWDTATAEEAGIAPALLMENAGKAALDLLKKEFSCLQGKKILIFMGKGNNGGDGAVLARLALNEGARVLVCHLHSLPETDIEDMRSPFAVSASAPKPAELHIALARACGVEFFRLNRAFSKFPEPDWEYPHIVVDALLGTGLKGSLRDEHVAIVKRINMFRNLTPANCSGGCSCSTTAADAQWPGLDWPAAEEKKTNSDKGSSCSANAESSSAPEPFVLALDIPSGLNGISGRPMPSAVAAHATISFEAPKPGLLTPAGRPWLGRLLVAPVGIPKEIKQRYPAGQALLMPGCADIGPSPFSFEHKNMAGKLLIVGGSTGMSGAPCLAALGAFRAGAGRVAVACPAEIENQIKTALPDLLTIPLGSSGEWTPEAAEALIPLLRNWDAVVIGPGMGLNEGAVKVVGACLSCSERGPVLADADALSIISQNNEFRSLLTWRDIIT